MSYTKSISKIVEVKDENGKVVGHQRVRLKVGMTAEERQQREAEEAAYAARKAQEVDVVGPARQAVLDASTDEEKDAAYIRYLRLNAGM